MLAAARQKRRISSAKRTGTAADERTNLSEGWKSLARGVGTRKEGRKGRSFYRLGPGPPDLFDSRARDSHGFAFQFISVVDLKHYRPRLNVCCIAVEKGLRVLGWTNRTPAFGAQLWNGHLEGRRFSETEIVMCVRCSNKILLSPRLQRMGVLRSRQSRVQANILSQTLTQSLAEPKKWKLVNKITTIGQCQFSTSLSVLKEWLPPVIVPLLRLVMAWAQN